MATDDDAPRFVPASETASGRAMRDLVVGHLLARWLRNDRRTLCEIMGWPYDEGAPVHLREYPKDATP